MDKVADVFGARCLEGQLQRHDLALADVGADLLERCTGQLAGSALRRPSVVARARRKGQHRGSFVRLAELHGRLDGKCPQ